MLDHQCRFIQDRQRSFESEAVNGFVALGASRPRD